MEEINKTAPSMAKEELVIYESRLRMPSREIAAIVRDTLQVDAEYSADIKRTITTDDHIVIFNYAFQAQHMKNFKKSVSAMYENLQLVLETIRDFAPK